MENPGARAIAFLESTIEDDEVTETVVALSGPDAPVKRDLGDGLAVFYAIDDGDHFTFIQHRHLSEAGMDEDQLHEQAVTNLSEAPDDIQLQPHRSAFGLLCGGNFEASLILLDHLWDGPLSEYVEEGFVVAVPARDILAFGDVGSPEAINDLKELVAQVWTDGDHLISRHLFRRVDSCWEKYDA